MKIISNDGTRANIKVTEAEVQRMIYTYERWIKTLCEEKKQLETSIATKDSELLQLKEELRQLKTNRDEAIKYIENVWYSKNTTNINDIGYTTNKLLKIKQLLERGKE